MYSFKEKHIIPLKGNCNSWQLNLIWQIYICYLFAILQYNSDTNHPQLLLDPTGLRAQSATRLPWFQIPAASSRVSRPPTLLIHCYKSRRFPQLPLYFNYFLNSLRTLEPSTLKITVYNYYKGHKSGPAKWRHT